MKTKYDWWGAACYVMNYSIIGFLASFVLLTMLIGLGWVALGFLAKTFGFIAIVIVLALISLLIIVGLTYREISKRGRLYAKY